MFRVIQFAFLCTVLLFTPLLIGCGDSSRVVRETRDQNFDDVRAKLAAESDLGKEEEEEE